MGERSMAENQAPHRTNDKFTDGIKPHWWPRVPPGKIGRLYANDALGLVDEDAIDDVGTSLLLRCQSILVANEAHGGRAACPRCDTIIQHRRNKRERIVCPACGWETIWAYYAKTFEGQGLLGGGSITFVRAYVETYEHAQLPRKRFLLIDRLIHAFHWEMHEQIGMSRPVACDLIAGRFEDVIEFLDTLTYGQRTTPEVQQEHAAWERKVDRSGEWFRQALAASRARRVQEQTGD
jgi:predicted RNA-binding Zn-ribbon protein involved in translation (DUF1610 family)